MEVLLHNNRKSALFFLKPLTQAYINVLLEWLRQKTHKKVSVNSLPKLNFVSNLTRSEDIHMLNLRYLKQAAFVEVRKFAYKVVNKHSLIKIHNHDSFQNLLLIDRAGSIDQ